MWTIYNAPSDRDYLEQFDPYRPEPEEPEKRGAMTTVEFDDFMDDTYRACRELTATKGIEYMRGSPDRFANFNRIAEELELPPLKVAYILWKKHLDAIVTYINTGQTFSTEPIRGRFLDLITYSFLMAGMTAELEWQKEHNPCG